MSRKPAGPRKVLRWFSRRILPPPPPVPSPAKLAADQVARGDLARDQQDWSAAAEAYAAALIHQPEDAAIAIQRGHMLKEAGQLEEAEAVYRTATEMDPFDAEPWLQRAHILKAFGRSDAAINAFVEALTRNPTATGARDELIAVGARSRLPRPVLGSEPAARELANIGRSLDMGLKALGELAQVTTFPLDAYDAFRRAFPVTPPPLGEGAEPIIVFVDATAADPAAVAWTLDSLTDQTSPLWAALVRSDATMRDHPVASRAATDPRIAFVAAEPEAVERALAATPAVRILALPAGTVLDPTAVAWFATAAHRTGAAVVYADHDYHQDHWRLGAVHQQPAFQSMPDPDDLATNPFPPVAALITADASHHLIDALSAGVEAAELGRSLILATGQTGPVAHLPRLLSSIHVGSPADTASAPLARPTQSDDSDARILVIVPTRDQERLLRVCVDSLRAFAERPEAVDILIVDNRSVEDQTRHVLSGLSALNGVEVVALDEPFNWARLNTEAARGQTQPLIVFANNDIEAIQRGWDSVVRRELSRPEIGAVGARLLYPDHTVQHGGVVLGMGEGRSLHEGLGAAPMDHGPMGRYRRTRPVAAVTGAFMAVRRETFERLGGFDQRLAVGYNDIDFCLRVRAAGLTVLYAADLTLIHHESRTRGLNDSAEKISWDDTELKRLFTTWGDDLFADPGVNPHWGSAPGRAFDGYRNPTPTQVLDWLDRSVRPRPWSIGQAS